MEKYPNNLNYPPGHIAYYHYSIKPYDFLLSKNAQINKPLKKAPLVTDDRSQFYNDTISLFIEPVPLDIIGKLWPDHPFWRSGAEIYQHVVLLDGIPDKLTYEMVETPELREQYENHPGDFDDAFLKRIKTYCLAKKIIGSGKEDMVYCTERYLGTTRQAYLRSAENNKGTVKYAPDVPHLMTRVLGGIIKVHSVSKVKIK